MECILRSILHVISNLSKQIPKIATRDEAAEKTHSWPVPRRGDRPIPDAIGHSGGVNKGFQALDDDLFFICFRGAGAWLRPRRWRKWVTAPAITSLTVSKDRSTTRGIAERASRACRSRHRADAPRASLDWHQHHRQLGEPCPITRSGNCRGWKQSSCACAGVVIHRRSCDRRGRRWLPIQVGNSSSGRRDP